jgi:hypothetical protein
MLSRKTQLFLGLGTLIGIFGIVAGKGLYDFNKTIKELKRDLARNSWDYYE